VRIMVRSKRGDPVLMSYFDSQPNSDGPSSAKQSISPSGSPLCRSGNPSHLAHALLAPCRSIRLNRGDQAHTVTHPLATAVPLPVVLGPAKLATSNISSHIHQLKFFANDFALTRMTRWAGTRHESSVLYAHGSLLTANVHTNVMELSTQDRQRPLLLKKECL
jgi:hypothetical protein